MRDGAKRRGLVTAGIELDPWRFDRKTARSSGPELDEYSASGRVGARVERAHASRGETACLRAIEQSLQIMCGPHETRASGTTEQRT